MKERPPEGSGPLTIGWKEYVSLPEWGVRRLKAKVDTGARTSVLDVVHYELRALKGTGLVAEMALALNPRRPGQLVTVQTPVLKMVAVRNSGGHSEERPLIETALRLGPVTRRILLTVTSRAAMRFRMLLGRRALENDFVVDVARKYLLRSVK
ncbi:MAG: ATP-dependent zinc protease [Gemmataceae bacterium]|nr:ATP-dependent zinc protease [Gemmataceae bacterium]